MKLLLGIAVLLVASACAHNRFEVVPSEVPPAASPSVVIKVEGNELDAKWLGTALREQLAARGVEVESGSLPGQSALLTINVETRPFQFNAYYQDGFRYYAPITRLFLEVELTGAGKREPYLELDLALDSIIEGASKQGYEGIETRDELVKRAARFVSLVYLNTLGGSAEPVEGVWVGALDDSRVAFRKDPARPRFNGIVIRSRTFGQSDNVYTVSDALVAGSAVPKRKGSYKIKYLATPGTSWHVADVYVYGCLMVMDPMTDAAGLGKSFWVKDGERCFTD